MKTVKGIHAIWFALFITACGGGGGGIVAAFSFIAPIGGVFKSNDQTIDLNFIFDQTLTSQQSGKATVNGLAVPLACQALIGVGSGFHIFVEAEDMIAYTDATKAIQCFSGAFEAIHKIRINSTDVNNNSVTTRLYREPAPHLELSKDVWVDMKNDTNRFKFFNISSDGELVKGCEVVGNSNQQAGIAADLWIYRSPYIDPPGDKVSGFHLTEVGGSRSASFIGYNKLQFFRNGQLTAEYERKSETSSNQVNCTKL